MTYSLDAKIQRYLASHGIETARVDDGNLIIPDKQGIDHAYPLKGVINRAKLDSIVTQHKEKP